MLSRSTKQLSVIVLWTAIAHTIFAFSVGVLWYWAAAVFVAAVCVIRVFTRHGFLHNGEGAPTLAWIISTLTVCGVFAVLWPSCPLMLIWLRELSPPKATGCATKPGESGVPSVEDPQQHEDRHQATGKASTDEGLTRGDAHQHERWRN